MVSEVGSTDRDILEGIHELPLEQGARWVDGGEKQIYKKKIEFIFSSLGQAYWLDLLHILGVINDVFGHNSAQFRKLTVNKN